MEGAELEEIGGGFFGANCDSEPNSIQVQLVRPNMYGEVCVCARVLTRVGAARRAWYPGSGESQRGADGRPVRSVPARGDLEVQRLV